MGSLWLALGSLWVAAWPLWVPFGFPLGLDSMVALNDWTQGLDSRVGLKACIPRLHSLTGFNEWIQDWTPILDAMVDFAALTCLAPLGPLWVPFGLGFNGCAQ